MILVTGGNGYFGSVLTKRLVADGEAVRVFDIRDAPDRPAEAELVEGDIRSASDVRRACDGVDVVHHNVAQVPLARDDELFWTVNYDGMRTLLEAVRDAGVRKLVAMSTSAVYGVPSKNPVDDSVPPRPLEGYGAAKLEAENLCREWAARGDVDVTIIRPRTIMGPGRLGIMQIVFEWVRTGQNVPVLAGGHNLYQFVHADDLADACVRAAARPGTATYNIGAAEFGTMRETLEGLIAHAGTASRVVSLPRRTAVLAMRATSAVGASPLGAYHWLMYGSEMYFDLTRPREELDWEPRIGNVAMFCEAYDWYVAHRDELSRGRDASHHRSAVRQGVLQLVSRGLRFL